MSWLRFEDHYDEHRKVAGLSDPAFRLNFRAIAWSSRNLTDGFVPDGVVRHLASSRTKKLSNELVEARLWEVADGGWRVHDYLDYQFSKEKVLADRAATRDQRVLAGSARASGPRGKDGRFTTGTSGDTSGPAGSFAGPAGTSGTSGSPADRPADHQPRTPNPYPVPIKNIADTDSSGQVSVGPSSPSGGTTARRLRGSRLSEKQLLEATGSLAPNPYWPLDPTDTRAVLNILANDQDLPDGDLNEALAYYNDILEDSPLKAKTVKSVANAMRPWLASWLRRDYLSTLMNRGNAPDRERVREALTESVLGTDQYSEMSNSDVEYAIELLEALIAKAPRVAPAGREYTADERRAQMSGIR